MAVLAGMTIGHPCTACNATMETCDVHIREHGVGCCPACFTDDTHGLLDQFRPIDVAELAQEIQNLTRLMAQMVIARTEHAKAIRSLRAESAAAIQENAFLRGRVQELEHREEMADERTKRNLIVAALTDVRTIVRNLPERVTELEHVAEALEAHLKLVRKPKENR